MENFLSLFKFIKKNCSTPRTFLAFLLGYLYMRYVSGDYKYQISSSVLLASINQNRVGVTWDPYHVFMGLVRPQPDGRGNIFRNREWSHGWNDHVWKRFLKNVSSDTQEPNQKFYNNLTSTGNLIAFTRLSSLNNNFVASLK